MPKVTRIEKFLIAFDLESGGLAISWFYLVVKSLLLFFIFCLLLMTLFLDCPTKNVAGEKMTEVAQTGLGVDANKVIKRDENPFYCNLGKFFMFVIFLIFGAVTGIFIWIAFNCINGIKTHDPVKLTPMMIWMVFLAVVSFFEILSFTLSGFSAGVSGVVINGYCFVVFHSLRENFREEIAQGVGMRVKDGQEYTAQNYDQDAYGQMQDTSYQQDGYGQSYQQQQEYIP